MVKTGCDLEFNIFSLALFECSIEGADVEKN